MRDPARIEPTMKLIEILWKRNPDLRLGQLMSNLGHWDLWNLEEDELQMRTAIALADGFPALYKRLGKSNTEVEA